MNTDLLDAPSPGAPAGPLGDTPQESTRADEHGTANLALVRVRIAVIGIGFVVVGAAAAGIFDRREWTLVVAALIPAMAALVLVGRHVMIRLTAAAGSVVLAAALAVGVGGGGTAGNVVGAFTSGVQGLLSTDWPSPDQPELLGTIAAGIATACAVSAELTRWRRFHLTPLLPMLIAYVAVVALSAPLGTRWIWLIALTGVATVLALLRNDGTLRDRLVLLRGERRLLPLLLIATTVVLVAAVPLSLGTRADPRRNDPAQQTAPLIDPIQSALALRGLDPPIDLHVITTTDQTALPVRWRTAALTNFDGRRWSPNLTLRPIGSTLGPATGPTITADVSFLDGNVSLVPLPGSPVEVDTPIETDADRSVVRLVDRPTPGDVVRVVANVPATTSDAAEVGISPRVVDESTSGLTQLAEGLAGAGSELERLSRLESTMRDDFVLDSQVQGGGLQQALIDRFLRDTQRGTSEQFATAFVLLARSLGIEARVATGFVADGDGDVPITLTAPGEPLVLSSSDAEIWPEVRLNDGRWLAFDPVPPQESTDGAPRPPEPQVQTPAAPQPPIAPPPESDSETSPSDEVTDTTGQGALSAAIKLVIRGGVALSAIALPFLIAAAIILGVKHRRRRHRLRAADAKVRIRGAWASATDALVDAGMNIETSTTDAEIAGDGAPLAPDATRELERLALMSSAATFGTPRHPDLLAQDAERCLDSIEGSLASERTRWQRLRWRLSLRSLRSSTRSPVTV